jgi:hypothetical protein
MTHHGYPLREALPDVIRAVAGVAATAGALAFLTPPLWMSMVLACLLLLFLLYGAQASQRWRMQIEMDGQGIRMTGLRRSSLLWSALEAVTIRYYSELSGGWFELVMRGGGSRLRINSRIHGFDTILRQAMAITRQRALVLDPTTRCNAAALGIPFDCATGDRDE